MARARTAPPREVPVDCSSTNDARERDATRRREGAFVAPGRAELTPVATRNVTFLDARPGPGRLVPLAITDAASLIKFLVLRRPPVTWPLGTLRPRPAEIRRHSRCAYVTFLGAGSSSSGTTTRHTRMVPLETHAHAASCGAELEIDSTWLRQHQFCWNNTGGGAARAEHGSLRSRRRPHRSRTTATRARRATMATLRAGGAKRA